MSGACFYGARDNDCVAREARNARKRTSVHGRVPQAAPKARGKALSLACAFPRKPADGPSNRPGSKLAVAWGLAGTCVIGCAPLGALEHGVRIRNRLAIVWLLTGLNLFNYLDRYVVNAVSPRIQDT